MLKVILLFVDCNNTKLKLQALQGERKIKGRDVDQNLKIEQKRVICSVKLRIALHVCP